MPLKRGIRSAFAYMNLVFFVGGLIAGTLTTSESHAQSAAPTKPYDAGSATYQQPAEKDENLQAKIAQLKKSVENRDLAAVSAALAQDYAALDCSPDPLKPCAPGKVKSIGAKVKPAITRIKLALCCEGKPAPAISEDSQNETLFAILGAALASGATSLNPDAMQTACAPGLPAIDRKKIAATAKTLGAEPENLRVTTAPTPLREKPDTASPIAYTLSAGAIAPLVTALTSATPPGWTAIAMPKGGVGFTDALNFDEIAPNALCFGKQKDGWKIVYSILRGPN